MECCNSLLAQLRCLKLCCRTLHLSSVTWKMKPKKPPPRNFMKFPDKGSMQYMARQLADPFVKQRLNEGYRCRSVYKLKEMDDKHNILHFGMSVVDLGAAPGSWSQVVTEKIYQYDDKSLVQDKPGVVVAVDLLRMTPIDGVIQITGDFTDTAIQKQICDVLKKETGCDKADVVLCDAAPNASGHKHQDHIILTKMLHGASDFVFKLLKPDGKFLFKMLDGSETYQLQMYLQMYFQSLKRLKPAASRKDSSELYILCEDLK